MWVKCCCYLMIYVAVDAVEIDVMGAINLGKKVAEALSQYLRDELLNSEISSRRSSNPTLDNLITMIMNTKLCKDENKFCTQKFEAFLHDYILSLTGLVTSVFDGVLEDETCITKSILKSIKLVKRVIKETHKHSDEVQVWTDVLKRCNAFFLEKVLKLTEVTSDKVKEMTNAKIILRQRFVIKLAALEKDSQAKLCREFQLCPFQYHASINLQNLLNIVKTLNDTEVEIFINEFKKTFLRSPIMKELDGETVKNFKETLHEMALPKSMGKDVLLSITDVVQKRLSLMEVVENDELILQLILSDLDHMYVNDPGEPIEHFMDDFKQWVKTDERSHLSRGMENLYNGLAAHFDTKEPELVFKLKTEAQVFLELAVGPSYAL